MQTYAQVHFVGLYRVRTLMFAGMNVGANYSITATTKAKVFIPHVRDGHHATVPPFFRQQVNGPDLAPPPPFFPLRPEISALACAAAHSHTRLRSLERGDYTRGLTRNATKRDLI